MKAKLSNDMKDAMRAKDKLKLSAVRWDDDNYNYDWWWRYHDNDDHDCDDDDTKITYVGDFNY